MSTLHRRQPFESAPDWLDDHVQSWVESGLVSPDQATRIIEAEHRERPEDRRVFTIGAEVAVYLGSLLALVAGAMVVGRSWDELSVGIRLGVALAIAALGFTCAHWLLPLGEPGSSRLASFMWAIATGGVALAIVSALDGAGVEEPAVYLACTGTAVTAFGVGLWRNLDRPLQVLTTAVGIGLLLGALGMQLDTETWADGLVVMTLGSAAVALAVTELLRPELYVTALGSIAAMIGSVMFTDLHRTAGFAVLATVAGAVVGIGLLRRLTPVVVIGVIGFLAGLRGLFETVLRGPGAALAVTVLGLAIVLVVIGRTTRRGPTGRRGLSR
jgi:hypothetical protein